MNDVLYNRALLRLAADAHGAGHLDAPDAIGHAHNPACGDRVTMEVRLDHGRIAALAHETRACIFAQASASLLGAHGQGLNAEEVAALRACVVEMLQTQAPPPQPPFAGYGVFTAAATIPGRHACVLLPFKALLDALELPSCS